MPGGSIPIKYTINFEKDEANVKVTYDLKVPVGNLDLIADLQISVGGTNIVGGFRPGQVRFNGTRHHVLANPRQDVPVSFSMSSNRGWTASDSSFLRGNKKYDGANFAG